MKSPPNAREMLATVRAWLALNYPGCTLECVKIRVYGIKKSIRIYESPVPVPVATEIPKDTVAEDERGARGLSPVLLDILKVLREVKRPLTRTRILEEMGRRGMDWSDRAVAGYLARLVEDGTLINDPEARPKGYRLADEEYDN